MFFISMTSDFIWNLSRQVVWSESCFPWKLLRFESLEFWFPYFIYRASQFELQYKINGYKISSTIVLNVFTSFGTIQNVFEWVKETVEAVIR